MNYYSMKDLVTEIVRKKCYNTRNDTDQTDTNAGNRVKIIREKLLPNLKLSSFIKEYKGHKQKPFNHEWYDFFDILLEYYEFNGTTKKENPTRYNIAHNPITVDSAYTIRNAKIFDSLRIAVEKGDNAEFFLNKLRETDFYVMARIQSLEFCIQHNFKTLFSSLNEKGEKEDLSYRTIMEILEHLQDRIPDLFHTLDLPFSPVIIRTLGVL